MTAQLTASLSILPYVFCAGSIAMLQSHTWQTTPTLNNCVSFKQYTLFLIKPGIIFNSQIPLAHSRQASCLALTNRPQAEDPWPLVLLMNILNCTSRYTYLQWINNLLGQAKQFFSKQFIAINDMRQKKGAATNALQHNNSLILKLSSSIYQYYVFIF